ncbi:MAG TPA: trypsin-like peptidase domain-containing protein [Vicinamibacterales bacterium]|nr:trypsin-like peptidase domain-containing protein [Vicinamibacterales bacterium]
MPDPSTSLRAGQDQTGFSRVCPSCGRRVPRNVNACRCGVELPAETFAVTAAAPEQPRSGSGSLIALVLGAVVVLAAAGYWFFLRPTPATSTASALSEQDDRTPEVAATTAPTTSAAARAWDAAANAKEPAPARPESIAPPPRTPAAPLTLSASTEEMVDRVLPAIVLIETTGGRGSGFFVRHDTLITNVHVVENDTYVTLRKSDGTTVNARVESKAPAFDIAILKVASPSPSQVVIPMGTARNLRPGQEIIVIGSALGTLQNSVSRGIVSGLRSSGGTTLVQTDAAANPGNSGGPMLDHNGSVIGVTTFRYKEAEGLNFGVAIDHARDLLEGRQTNLGTTGGLMDMQARTRGSESDREQQQGEEQLRGNIGQLAKIAGQIDDGWKRYREQCYRSPIPGRYDREWFAMLVPRGMPADAGSGCASFYADMESDTKLFRSQMRRTIDDARRANVLPGTIRDLLRTNRLEFDWER